MAGSSQPHHFFAAGCIFANFEGLCSGLLPSSVQLGLVSYKIPKIPHNNNNRGNIYWAQFVSLSQPNFIRGAFTKKNEKNREKFPKGERGGVGRGQQFSKLSEI